jgi:uncharacterized protein DUF3999
MRTYAAMLIGAFVSSANGESPADFAYRIPLAIDGDAAFVRVELPAPVYEGAVRRDLGDLRVFNGEGTGVAFAFMPRPAAAREAAVAFDVPYFPLRAEATRTDVGDLAITVRRTQNGTTVDLATHDGRAIAPERLIGYLVDASEAKEPLAALTLPLPSGANLTTRVRVDASDDLTSWRTVVANAPLLALESGGRRLTRERIDMPPTTAKYLRVTFVSPNPAIEVASIRAVAGDRAVEAPRQWRDATGVAVRDTPGTYEFDLGGTFPVDRVTLALPEQNTVAPTELFARVSEKDEWRLIAAAVFYRLRQEGGEAVNPPVAAGGDYRYWKIRVDPKAGAMGSQTPRLSVGWYPGGVVFAARGRGPFELAYGSARATPAALAIDTLVPGYDRTKRDAVAFPQARPGAVTALPASRALETPIDAKRWLLWASLALGAIVLGWMAFSLSRQMRESAAGRSEEPPSDAR